VFPITFRHKAKKAPWLWKAWAGYRPSATSDPCAFAFIRGNLVFFFRVYLCSSAVNSLCEFLSVCPAALWLRGQNMYVGRVGSFEQSL
jgi:hypothetical protein